MMLYNCRCRLLQTVLVGETGPGVVSTELRSFASVVTKHLLHRPASGFQHLKHYFSSTARAVRWKNYDLPWAMGIAETRHWGPRSVAGSHSSADVVLSVSGGCGIACVP